MILLSRPPEKNPRPETLPDQSLKSKIYLQWAYVQYEAIVIADFLGEVILARLIVKREEFVSFVNTARHKNFPERVSAESPDTPSVYLNRLLKYKLIR